ncbi:MAG: isochorismatase family protein [Candidatus Marinimicrobia bacterium]|nr:isochorismatase family protein [Candidatus Neomarinimicrobiota bacterium]
MKSTYFTAKTIQAKSGKMLERIATTIFIRPVPNIPHDCALLVLDMQDYFLSPDSQAYIPSAPAIIPGINRLINLFGAASQPVIFTRHLNTLENAGPMKHWWRNMIMENNPRSRITSALNRVTGTILIKSQYDAFHQTELNTLLKRRNVSRVIITGVMTHLCCESTARSAFMRGYEVVFTIDGTATYNEQFHYGTLLNLAHGFATPVLIDQIIDQQTKNEAD